VKGEMTHYNIRKERKVGLSRKNENVDPSKLLHA